MPSFNRLAVRKEIGAIRYRLDEVLTPSLRHAIISRHLDNLDDTLPAEYRVFVDDCRTALKRFNVELVACLAAIDALVPPTYGSIPAGTDFILNGEIVTKRKDGVEYHKVVGPHLSADLVVTIINE